jgi:molecular chaperone GrpE
VTDEPRAAGGPAPAGEPDVTARSPARPAAGGEADRPATAGSAGAADGAATAPRAAGEGGPAGEAPAGEPEDGAATGPRAAGEGGSPAEDAGTAPQDGTDTDAPGRPGPSATDDDTAAGEPAAESGGGPDDAEESVGTDEVEVDADLQAAADALEVDLELLLSERAQYLDAYRRAQADFENYRKQAQRRQDDAVVRALGAFVERLLPVLDSCDAALAHGASEVEPVLTALYGALSKEGLERIDPKGAAFDPTEAEAVVHEPGEGGEHVVAEVLRPGYRWRGKVLRPAMVKVTD